MDPENIKPMLSTKVCTNPVFPIFFSNFLTIFKQISIFGSRP